MRVPRTIAVVGLGLISTLSPLAVWADPSASDLALAETLFRAAKELIKDNKPALACPKYAESYRLDPKLGTLINLADCHELEGKTASAWGEFNEAAIFARKNGKPDREKLAIERAKALESKLARLTIEVDDPATQVQLDGQPVNAAVLGTPFPVDPGEHVIVASAKLKKPSTLKLTVAATGSEKVKLPKLENAPVDTPTPPVTASATTSANAPPTASAAPTTTSSPPPPSPSGMSSGQTAGVVLGGVGVIGLGVGTVFGVIAIKSHSSGNKTCAGTTCDAAGKAHQDNARGEAQVSTVTFLLGGALVATGAILYLTMGPSKSSNSGSIQLSPTIAPGLAGVVAGGAF